jgi:hypothetical protein
MEELPQVETPEVLIGQLDALFGDESEAEDVDIHLPDGIVVHIERDKYRKTRLALPDDDDAELLIVTLIDKDVQRQQQELKKQFIERTEKADSQVIDEEADFGTLADGSKMDVEDSMFIHTAQYPNEITLLDNEVGLLAFKDKHIRLTTMERPPVKAGEDHGDKEESTSKEGTTTEGKKKAGPVKNRSAQARAPQGRGPKGNGKRRGKKKGRASAGNRNAANKGDSNQVTR